MKKRVITILIALAALVSLLVIPANAASSGKLMAGYYKVDIDPNRHPDGAITGLPMGGYGAVTERLSSGQMDDTGDGKITTADGLFATCTAITDQYDTTIIHFGVDNTNASQEWTNGARRAVIAALNEAGYDVSYDNVFITASHSHSSPQLTFNDSNYPAITEKVTKYREWVFSQMATAAVNAMKDRVEVTMTKGAVDASDAIGKMYTSATTAQKRMNWVRHYKSTLNGETVVGGSNFGAVGSGIKEVSAPNDTMHLVQFTPVSGSKKPILLINWTAHATMNSSGGSGGSNTTTYGGIHHTDVSSDYINSLRNSLENNVCYNTTIKNNYFSKVTSTQTYRVSFISGAAGNVTPSTSHMTSSQDPDVKGTSSSAKSPEGHLYGQKLAAIARYGLKNSMTSALDTSSIRVKSETFTYDRQMPSTSDRDFIYAMREVTVSDKNLVQYLTTNSTNWGKRSDYYTQFPYLKKFTSRYQLSNMNSLVTNYYDNGKTTGSMTVSAIAIGTQLSITVNPCELADRFSIGATLSNTSDNDWDDLISSTYGTPLVMGYTNGASGYVPNALAYNYNSGSTASGGDGADTSDNYITGSYESSGASFAKGTGEKLITFYADMLADVNVTGGRVQCECGGKAKGMTGHTCSDVEFLPWSDATSLPTYGNYYLTTDVTLSAQQNVSTLRLDLNGHNITRKIPAETTAEFRLFSVTQYLKITDSTSKAGTLSRDLTALTDDQKASIGNWGLLVLVGSGADVAIFDGVFDSTNAATTGGGSVISNNYADSNLTIYGGTFKGGTAKTGSILYNAGTANMYGGTFAEGTATTGGLITNFGTFNMYGGTLTGGVSDNAGAVYNGGTAKFFGGTVTGNKTVDNGTCPGIYCTADGKLTIGGSVEIDENRKTRNSVEMNIRFATLDAMAAHFTVSGEFTGKAGVFLSSDVHANGLDIGVNDNASFDSGCLTLDYKNPNNFEIVASGSDIIMATVKNQCECGGKATSGKYGHTCEKVDYLPWTSTTTLPSSGNYYLTDNVVITAQKNITGTLRLDLNGKNITHKVAATATDTRVFSTTGSAHLAITDSTSTPGTVTRDLSSLTTAQQEAIENYGLLFILSGNSEVIVYNGTFDATGMYAGGGACICTFGSDSTFKMYGGALKGGITNSGGIMFNRGHAEFYGGTVTGGVTKVASGACGGIYVVEYNSVPGTLTIGGDVEIYDNKKSNGNQINIRYSDEANMADNFTITGDFTGKASFYVGSRTDKQVIGVNDNASFGYDNFYLDIYSDGLYDLALNGNDIILAAAKTQCECGGKAVGKYGHTCENLTWKPWNSSSALPTEEGNYYLTTDVTTTAQKGINAAIRIDLNGHDITHKVKSGVFYINAGGSLVITDSTANPGKVTRDLSNLTTAQKEAITNYGLIVMISTSTESGGFTLYNGTLDASGMYTYGGAVTCLNSVSPIKIYGGTINGGIANTSSTDGGSGYSGGIFTWAPLEIHGGIITGSSCTRASGGGGVYFTKTMLLTGDPTITGNTDANGDACNICSAGASKITVSGAFTGTVGFNVAAPAANAQVAKSSLAVITNATLSIDNYPSYSIAVSGSYLVMRNAYAASITVGENVTYVDTLNNAIKQYPGGDAVLTVLQDTNDNVTFTKDTILDLNGCDLTGTVTANGKLTVFDSQTDDLTISDAAGYGKLPTSLSAAEAADGYIKITENDGISFHKLILATVGINLRPSTAGMYYTSDFGGDEVIKRNLTTFGVALGADGEPDFAPKTYTAFSNNSWVVGINADGSTKNRTNGTILQNIMVDGIGYSTNTYRANLPVWGTAYIELLDGTRITEKNTIKFSLRNIIEGFTGFNGVDDLWDTLSDTQKGEAVAMYKTYEKVMKNWDIPNIKQALIDGQDDGVLKILMIGHSLGMDSTYFVPEVLKNETGENVVVGTLYHSGCRLNQHVDYLQRDAEEYAYLEYDTSTDTAWRIWETEEGQNKFVTHTPNQAHDSYIGAAATNAGNANKYGVTMQFGISRHDWDIVVMQAGVFEAANVDDSATYSPNITADIKTIQNYVKTNDANKYTAPKFAWNITWSAPEDKTLSSGTSYDTLLASKFNDSSVAMYEAIIDTFDSQVKTAYAWDHVFPSGTTVQNAKTVLTDKQIHRDMIHATDLIRLAVAYTWYCELFDKDISECGFDPISNALRFQTADRNTGEDYTLTTEEKGYVKDFVRNAMTNPYEVTQIEEPDDVLKVLVIGHSTGMDPIYFVPEIAKANGVNMIVGDLYHSGCRLSQHETFIKNNAKEYVYLEYDNSNTDPWQIWQTGESKLNADGTVAKTMTKGWADHLPNQAHDSYVGGDSAKLGNAYGVTMQWAIQQHDWDIVIMMGGRYETTDIFNDGQPLDITDIGVIRDYVLANDINKTTVPDFAWNTLWTTPENDEAWKATLTDAWRTSYENSWNTVEKYYEGSTLCLYEHFVAGLQNHILPAYNFDYLLHNNTVIQNAKNYGLSNSDIYRDYTHGTDFTRMMVAANWFCGITGMDVSKITIPSIPAQLRFKTADRNSGEAYTLTSTEKETLIFCVKNAIDNPYEVTKK